MGGYHSQNKTRDRVTKRYYWPNITTDIARCFNTCERCQKAKAVHLQKAQKELHPIYIPNQIWTQISTDLLGNLTESPEGYKYVLTVIYYFTKWPEMITIKDKNASTIAKELYSYIILIYLSDHKLWLSKIIISDRGMHTCKRIEILWVKSKTFNCLTKIYTHSCNLYKKLENQTFFHLCIYSFIPL